MTDPFPDTEGVFCMFYYLYDCCLRNTDMKQVCNIEYFIL